jgi:hypothetical protein
MEGKRLVPSIIGPNGKFYVTDHHHMSNAVYWADLSDAKLGGIDGSEKWKKSRKKRELLVYVLFNLSADYLKETQPKSQDSSYEMSDFVGSMNDYSKGAESPFCEQAANGQRVSLEGIGLTWPCDEHGKPISFEEIAYEKENKERKIWDLADDPYRSLSRWVRDSYGYLKCGRGDPNLRDYPECTDPSSGNPAFFMEFEWANFMRAHFMKEEPEAHEIMTVGLDPGDGQLAAISRYLPIGIRVATSQAAKAMIGFNDGSTESAEPRPFPAYAIAQDDCELLKSLDDLGTEMGWDD